LPAGDGVPHTAVARADAPGGADGVHVRFFDRRKHLIQSLKDRSGRGQVDNPGAEGGINHAHQNSGGKAMARDVGDIGEDRAVTQGTTSTTSPPTSVLGIGTP
jgi:hypothetical protein